MELSCISVGLFFSAECKILLLILLEDKLYYELPKASRVGGAETLSMRKRLYRPSRLNYIYQYGLI